MHPLKGTVLHCRMQQVKSDWKEVSAIKPSLNKVTYLWLTILRFLRSP